MSSRSPTLRLITLGLLCFALPKLSPAAETIALSGATGPAGVRCPHAEGAFVAFLLPDQGTLVVATTPFPGGRRVGALDGRRLRASVEGLGDYDLETVSTHEASPPVWGMVDRSLEIGPRTGCFGFDERDFSSVDDLKTYLHWILRDLFFRLRSANDPEPLALYLADRVIRLEVTAAGQRPARLEIHEAGTVGLRLPDSSGVYYFQPFVLDQSARRLAVKVLYKEDPYFGAGVAREVAFVTAGPEAPGVTATDPVLEIRTVGIE